MSLGICEVDDNGELQCEYEELDETDYDEEQLFAQFEQEEELMELQEEMEESIIDVSLSFDLDFHPPSMEKIEELSD